MENTRQLNIKLTPFDMPLGVEGVTVNRGCETEYEVYLNNALGELEKAAAFLHEMLHIYHEDIDYQGNIGDLEAERRAELKALLQILIDKD